MRKPVEERHRDDQVRAVRLDVVSDFPKGGIPTIGVLFGDEPDGD